MSWASRRETSREEDMAYCLMGLFGVNMPPLHGEGENAFRRLQLEILNISDDESIFAWKERMLGDGGLLARSPVAFEESGDIRVIEGPERSPFAMTNKGLCIELLLVPRTDFPKSTYFQFDALAPLNCGRRNGAKHIALVLNKGNGNRWCRSFAQLLEWNGPYDGKTQRMEVIYFPQYVRKSGSVGVSMSLVNSSFLIKPSVILANGFSVAQQHPPSDTAVWKTDFNGLSFRKSAYSASYYILRDIEIEYGAILFVNAESKKRFVLTMEVDDYNNFGVNILIPKGISSLESMLKTFYEKQSAEEKFLRHDRVSKSVDLGLSVSAVIKKETIEGQKVHVVYVTTSKSN